MKERNEGLTDYLNRFHDSQENGPELVELRRRLSALDQATAAAYGWTDLNLGHGFYETKQGVRYAINEIARSEVLTRLLKLNHEYYVEEARQGSNVKKSKISKKAANVNGGMALFELEE